MFPKIPRPVKKCSEEIHKRHNFKYLPRDVSNTVLMAQCNLCGYLEIFTFDSKHDVRQIGNRGYRLKHI